MDNGVQNGVVGNDVEALVPLLLLLVALGFANMWMGIFADVGVMVLAVLNAIRALRTSKN